MGQSRLDGGAIDVRCRLHLRIPREVVGGANDWTNRASDHT